MTDTRGDLTGRDIPARTETPVAITETLAARIPTRNTTRVLYTPSIGGGGVIPSRPGITDNGVSPNYQSFYGGNSFGVLADLYRNIFGNSDPVIPTNQPSIIPVPIGESGGSGNNILIIVIIGLAVFGMYYFYFRKTQ